METQKVKYLQPQEILNKFGNKSVQEYKKNVKIVERAVPFYNNYNLSDISLSAGGNDEDIMYVYSEDYRTNIRRGNSIITEFGKNNQVKGDYWARKGMPKFFDLCKEYMQYNLGEMQDFTNFGIKNQTEHAQIVKIIFDEAKSSIQSGKKVEILKMNKANGENCQISYFRDTESWIIASKNVSLMAKYRKDISQYVDERYHFAKLIAHSWFDILQDIQKNNKNGNMLVKELQEDLDNVTIIGEYCGNRNYQHLVKYSKIQLFFYSIVDNESRDVCVPPSETYNICQKYGLQNVKMESLGVFGDFKQFNQTLKTAFDTVSEANIEDEEEGSVLYFIEKEENQFDRVLSLSKLKTLEYRLFRKLREKLRNYISRKNSNKKNNNKNNFNNDFEKILQKYESECQQLCIENKPARPLEYYYAVARKAFEFGDRYGSNIIQDEFITFLAVVLDCMDKNIEILPKMFNDQKLIDQLLKKSWNDYKTENVLQNSQIQSQNKQKQQEQKQNGSKNDKKITVIVPISIPGMGKTTFRNSLGQILKDKKQGDLIVISSDEIRRDLIEKRAQKFPHENSDTLFSQTGKLASKSFQIALKNAFQNQVPNSSQKNIFVFIDKNHPSNAMEKAIKDVENVAPQNYDLEFVGLVPDCQDETLFTTAGDNKKYPFSLDFFFNCINRVQTRTQHPTLTGSGTKSMNVMVMFASLFQDVSMSDNLLLNNGFHKVLRFPFHQKDSKITYNSELVNAFSQVLNITRPGKTCENYQLLQKLVDIFEQQKFQFKQPKQEEIDQKVVQFLDSLNQISEKSTQQQAESSIIKSSAIEEENDTQDNQNSQKSILYQGIFANSQEEAEKMTKKHVLEILQKLLKNNSNNAQIKNDLDSNLNQFIVPQDMHITSQFLGGKMNSEQIQKQQQEQNITLFQEGIDMDIEVLAIAYVPGKLVCGYCQPNQKLVHVYNEFPHMTMLTQGNFKPVHSNSVLKSLFLIEQNSQLLEKFKKGEQLTHIEKAVQIEKLGQHDIHIFAVKDFVLKSQTRNIYVQNNSSNNNYKQNKNSNKATSILKNQQQQQQIQHPKTQKVKYVQIKSETVQEETQQKQQQQQKETISSEEQVLKQIDEEKSDNSVKSQNNNTNTNNIQDVQSVEKNAKQENNNNTDENLKKGQQQQYVLKVSNNQNVIYRQKDDKKVDQNNNNKFISNNNNNNNNTNYQVNTNTQNYQVKYVKRNNPLSQSSAAQHLSQEEIDELRYKNRGRVVWHM